MPHNRASGGHIGNSSACYNRGRTYSRSIHGQNHVENEATAAKTTIVQQERYRRRTPSPPPIVKLCVRDKKLLWPIGPFIPFDMWGCPPWEMDSKTFVNVLCTTVVHQTGVNQVQYSDPTTRDPDIPLPPIDGSPDPRTSKEYQYNLQHYLCLNESRGVNSHGFTEIGIPAKRLNFHPFGPSNFDSLWYGMAHLQELVCADDNATVKEVPFGVDARKVLKKGIHEVMRQRTETMMGRGGPKFAEHEEVLNMNCHAPPLDMPAPGQVI
ncbi:hypothetical protein ABW20_dc0110212 [Dactylellina cionopaga]|nr:hypothetical protein ABW20_dc0110212 [Dactylellina cionopaga]